MTPKVDTPPLLHGVRAGGVDLALRVERIAAGEEVEDRESEAAVF